MRFSPQMTGLLLFILAFEVIEKTRYVFVVMSA